MRVVRTVLSSLVAVAAFILFAGDAHAADAKAAAAPADWSMNATIIEACSCPMFCQCYFATKPAAHATKADPAHAGHDHASHGGEEHFCRFNNAFRVNKGTYGATKLDGARFWVAGDLGDEFSDGEMDWAVLTYDPSVTPAQREGIQAALAAIYPVKWKSFTIAPDAPMEWEFNKNRAVAKLGGGKTAEVVLNRNQGMTNEPIVIQNLVYWGVPRNDGFVLMANEVNAYRTGDKAFEFNGTNGFMITFDINSKDAAAKKKS
ncbi:MAG: DUF1326 domain-containing protein [Candidatus Eiseniibacteriota bacterium]